MAANTNYVAFALLNIMTFFPSILIIKRTEETLCFSPTSAKANLLWFA